MKDQLIFPISEKQGFTENAYLWKLFLDIKLKSNPPKIPIGSILCNSFHFNIAVAPPAILYCLLFFLMNTSMELKLVAMDLSTENLRLL